MKRFALGLLAIAQSTVFAATIDSLGGEFQCTVREKDESVGTIVVERSPVFLKAYINIEKVHQSYEIVNKVSLGSAKIGEEKAVLIKAKGVTDLYLSHFKPLPSQSNILMGTLTAKKTGQTEWSRFEVACISLEALK